MENVNDSYFDGIYKDLWRTIIPEILTEKEINFIVSYFDLKPGDKVLDLMCGYGRHTLALARLGINVTAVDNLKSYKTEIEKISRKERLPVEVICESVLKYRTTDNFDLVLCMGNSLNFYDKAETNKILSRISNAMKPNGSVLINSWSLAEIVLDSFQEESEGVINGIFCTTRSQLLYDPLRVVSESQFCNSSGLQEKKIAVDYIYTLLEMEEMLIQCGMKLTKVYSVPYKKEFTAGDKRAYLIATRK